jgi:hypothetical protein
MVCGKRPNHSNKRKRRDDEEKERSGNKNKRPRAGKERPGGAEGFVSEESNKKKQNAPPGLFFLPQRVVLLFISLRYASLGRPDMFFSHSCVFFELISFHQLAAGQRKHYTNEEKPKVGLPLR